MPHWWCGSCDTTLVDHLTWTPCTTETVVAPLVLLVSAAVLYAQQKRVKLLKPHRSYLGLGESGLREATVAALVFAVAVSHSVWLVHYLVQRKAAFHYLYETALALNWCAALVSSVTSLLARNAQTWCQVYVCKLLCNLQAVLWQGKKHTVSVHLKFLLWPALFVYLWAVYTYTRIYLEHWDVDQPKLRIALLATAAFQACLTLVAAVIETVKYAWLHSATMWSGLVLYCTEQPVSSDVLFKPHCLGSHWQETCIWA